MAVDWNQLPFTAQQQAAMKALVTYSTSDRGTTPPLTYSQSKAAKAALADLFALVVSAQQGATRAIDHYKRAAIVAFDAANP